MILGRGNSYILLPAFCFLAMTFLAPAARASDSKSPAPPTLSADAAVLVDYQTGQVLFNKNGSQKKPPASTTKIMTAILALQGGRLSQEVTVSPAAAAVGEASLELTAGERLTLGELVYGALLNSGNDACVAIAEHIAGTENNFVLLMNQKARLLGACDTSFKNTNGLPAFGHYSTALDLATLARYALSDTTFKEIVGTREKIIGGGRYLHNTNRLLWGYPGADGVKTGTTDEAGGCLVASATREGRQLISVVLHSEDRWNDSIGLLEYGFGCFDYVRVLARGEAFASIRVKEGRAGEIQAVASSELGALCPGGKPDSLETRVDLQREITAPVYAGEKLGTVSLYLGGEKVGSANLVADRNVRRLPSYSLLWKNTFNFLIN